MKNIIIHVGKCSGTALIVSLNHQKINFEYIHHADNPNPQEIIPLNLIKDLDNYQFIFCIRHPIDRFISAFNFKYTCGIIRNERNHFQGEIEGFKFFKSIQNLAENLYLEDGKENSKAFNFCNNCDHMKYGLHHYLKNFNDINNIKICRHEYLKEDYKNIFKQEIFLKEESYQPNFISKFNSSYQKFTKVEITQKMYANLKNFLKKDLEIIEKLAKDNLITEEYRDYCVNQLPHNIILID